MAYDEKLWEDIKQRVLAGESPGVISKSLNGKPSKKAIQKKINSENWEQEKSQKVAEYKKKSSRKFPNILHLQHRVYKKISDKFEASINDTDELGFSRTFCSVKDVVATYKDWREVFALRQQENKANVKEEQDLIDTLMGFEEGRAVVKKVRGKKDGS